MCARVKVIEIGITNNQEEDFAAFFLVDRTRRLTMSEDQRWRQGTQLACPQVKCYLLDRDSLAVSSCFTLS